MLLKSETFAAIVRNGAEPYAGAPGSGGELKRRDQPAARERTAFARRVSSERERNTTSS
jgi:hypothetical protein